MATPTQSVKVYYGKPMLPDVSRILACLYEKDVKFELIDMYEGQTINPDLIKFQASRAPVSGFEDGNIRLFESRAICRHIVDKYANQGNKYLLGRDLLERASIEQWLKSEEHSFDPPSWALIFHLAFNVEPDPELITQSERKLSKVLDVYEQRLGESKFLAGDEFSLADLSHLPNSHYLVKSEEWGYLFESRKNVRKWWEEISSRHSWQEVVKIVEISSRHSWQEVVKIVDKVGIRGKDIKTSNGRYHFLMHEKLDLHSFDQTTTSKTLSNQTEDLIDKQTPLNTESSTQPTAAVAPSNQVQGKDVGPKTEEDSNGQSTTNAQSSTQIARPDAPPSSKQEKTAQLMHQVDSSGGSAIPISYHDSQSSTQLSAPALPSVQKQGQEDSTDKLLAKEAAAQPANIGTPSNQTKGSRSSAQSSTQLPGSLASKEQEKNTQQENQADTARKSIEQEGTKDGLLSMLSSQKQEKFSQPMDQADSRSQMTDQRAHLDAQSSNKETAIGSLPSQKKENTGQEPRQAEADKSIAEKATTDAQPTTPQPVPGVQSSQEKDQVDQKTVTKQGQTDARSSIQQGLPEAIPSKIQEKIAQSMSQEDSEGKSIPQRQTTKDTPDVRSSLKREENSEQTSQDSSPSKTTVKQELTDPLSSTKEGSFDAISSQKQEKQEKTMDKANHAGQEISEIKSFTESSTPDSQSSTKQKQDAQQATTKQGSSVGQSSTQRNPPDTMLNQKQEQAAQLTGKTEIKGQPISQQAKVDAQSSTNDQSSQKQEQDTKQTLQENPSSPSVADQRPSNAKILTQQTPPSAILNQKEEENSTETGRADSPGESIGKRDTTVDNSSNAQTSTKSASEKDSTGGSGNQSGTSSQSKD